MTNELIMQAFEWYLPSDGNHWKKLEESISDLKNLELVKSGYHQHLRELAVMM